MRWENIKSTKNGLRRDLLLGFFTIASFLAFIPIFTYIVFAKDLGSKESLMNHNNTGVVILDRKDRPFFSFYQAKFKEDIPLSNIPDITQQATIASEDKDFYSHPGFSPKSIFRAFWSNLTHQNLAYGASTLTQQLVKNSLLHSRKDFLRKYQEVILAQETERRYSKKEILEMYLNTVYFGEGAFGIEEAAKTYFDKDAKDLTLAESAYLIGLLPEPSKLSPFASDGELAKKHEAIVLDKMVEQKYITSDQKNKALAQNLKISQTQDDMNILAPHFALMIRDELIQKYGEERVVRSGFKVYTGLDLDWQKFAQDTVQKRVAELKGRGVGNGAAVVVDPKSGEIRALVGSKDWYDNEFGKVNIVTSTRPPGSSFKPIVYVAAFEKRLITPATVLHDQPTKFRNDLTQTTGPNAFYEPKDYDSKYRGPVLPRRALANSLNIPAVEVMSKVGLDNAMDMAKRLGITTLKDKSSYGLSLVLGTADVRLLDMSEVYSSFATGGIQNTPTSIVKIEDKAGNTIFQHVPEQKRVLGEQESFMISSILSDNNARQELFGNALSISRPAAVKTGTTEDYKDAWTLGYTPSLVVGVWVGNNFGQPMDRIAGSLGAAPIWRDLMEQFLAGTPVEKFNPPSGLVNVSVCEASSSGKEFFLAGTEPKASCRPTPQPSGSSQPQSSNQPQPSNSPVPSPSEPPANPTPQANPDKNKKG